MNARIDSQYVDHIRQIEHPHSLEEILDQIESGEYCAELLLQHAMRLLLVNDTA